MEMHNVYACDQRPNSIKTDKQTNKKNTKPKQASGNVSW